MNSPTIQDPSSTIEATDPEPAAQIFETTLFTDDTATREASLPERTPPSLDVLASGTEARQHTIEEIMCRPTIIAEGKWSASNLRGESLQSLVFPNAILDRNENMQDKIKRFAFFRADVVIRIMVNATPFQKGKLIAYFTPYSNLVGNRSTLNEHMPARTSFPHTIIDASTGNTGLLRIPYVSPYTHYNLVIPNGDLGTLNLNVFNEVVPADCNYTIVAQFDNVDLSVPTAALAPTTLSSISTTTKRTLELLKDAGLIGIRNKSRMEELGFRAQMAEDQVKSSKGIVTSTLEKISSMSSALGNVPTLSTFFKPVAWVASVASGVASAAGWGKPTSIETQKKFQQQPAFGFTHVEGLDQSVTLGAMPDNQLVPRSDLFGSTVDEMDIGYVCSHFNNFHTFQWKTSDARGVKLFSAPVHPGLTELNGEFINPTLLAFTTSMFEKWRGGITFKVQLAKTAFHSGKLRIAFVPSGNVTDFAAQVYDLSNCHNIIADFRTSDEIEFNIPYTSTTPWKNTALLGFDSTTTSDIYTGIMAIEVINPLVANTSVSAAVDVNLWIKGAPDISFACPTNNRYKVRDIPIPPPPNDGFRAQVLGSFQDPGFNSFAPSPNLFAMDSQSKTLPEELCIGEKITSFRQLIHRFTGRKFLRVDKNGYEIKVGTSYFGDAGDSSPVPLDFISWLYRFYRGSTRHKFMYYDSIADGAGKSNNGALLQVKHLIRDGNKPNGYTLAAYGATTPPGVLLQQKFATVQPTLLNPYMEITAPYYMNTAITPVSAVDAPESTNLSYNSLELAITPVDTTTALSGGDFGTLTHLVAAGDDFTFGWLVGAPTLAINS